MKVLIVDDEFPARKLIELFLKEVEDVEIIGECDNGLDAIKFVQKHNVDLIFLDIKMYQKDGIQTAFEINRIVDSPYIVFTTGFTEYAVKAFELKAIDYIVKPYTKDRIIQAVSRVKELHNSSAYGLLSNDILYKQGKLPVWSSDHLFVLNYTDVLYFKAYKKGKSYVFSTNGRFITDLSLNDVEQELKIKRFLRVHKSFIINIDKITEIIPWFNSTYILKINECEDKIPVSRHYINIFKKIMRIAN